MKDLEEVNCEIRRVVDLRHSVSDRLNNLGDNNRTSNALQRYDASEYFSGGFLNNASYAWLCYDCHLVILNVRTGESTSSWTFRSKITCVSQFPTQLGELPLLLVGLDNEAARSKDSMGLICIFDCTTSRVLRAIKMPVGVEQACIISGGAKWEEVNDKRPGNIMSEMCGAACVVLRDLYHIVIDLQRPTWEECNSLVVMDETSPAEMEIFTGNEFTLRNQSNRQKHLAYNLLNSRIERHIGFNREEFESTAFLDENLTTVIVSSMKIGCLISGCLGRVIIWQNDGSVGWISSSVYESMAVTHLALLEPTDDPRPFYYLWVVFQDEESKMPPLLRMYALLFERKYCNRGTNFYYNLEAEPSLKFEFELERQDRVVSLSTIERETNPDQTESEITRGEDNLLLIATMDRTLLFDLNQWYKEQMPQTIGECKNPNSIIANYSTKFRAAGASNGQIISSTHIPHTLQEFANNSPTSPEEFYFPNSFSLDWVELSSTKLTFWMSRGVQADLLREIAIAGPIVLTQPSETFNKCVSVGLVPVCSELLLTNNHNAQREMLLSLCLEQRWATFLVRCANEWSDGSAAYLYPSFLKWGIQRASTLKQIADQICVPLFDQSGNNIGEAEVKSLRFYSQQLECLSNVVGKLPFETADLLKQRRALKRVSMYFQVLLWFYDVGLLPETQDLEDSPPSISLELKVPYPFEKLFNLYREKRESNRIEKDDGEREEVFFIDELIARECPAIKLQWEKEAGDIGSNGYYPPPSLQSLLRSYLTDCNQTELEEIEYKHQITIYLLMDLAMLLQGSYPGVDQLIKYPSAFKMSPSLIKLTQAFWLLDHEDYKGFLDMMTGQLVLDSDVKDWHHKLVLRTLVRYNQHKLALMYLRIRKPPLSSVSDQSTLISLSVEHGLVQSAFHRRPQSHYSQLLASFFEACQNCGKLSDILHLALDSEEEQMFVKFLEGDKSGDMRVLYYLQRCRYTEANNGSIFPYNTVAKPTQSSSLSMLQAYNATLPNVVKRFSLNMAKTNFDLNLEPRYPRPMSHYKSCIKSSNIYETVIKKAKETFMRNEKSQIPFISAPCSSLKLNDDRANVNCVLFPKFTETSRKRSFDQIHGDEDNETKTPDMIKRRKLVDNSETTNRSDAKDITLNVSFNTPLVKRKSNVPGKDQPMETPHSILKIRQLIGSSTSPNIVNSQSDVSDDRSCKREKKLSRQIRFSINQPEKNISYVEVNDDEDESSKHNILVEDGKEDFTEWNANSISLTESTVLSDNSCISKHAYTPRPRPSLRRICLEPPLDGSCELEKCTTKSLWNSSTAMDNCSNISRSTPSVLLELNSPECNTALRTSMYTPPVLISDSSFESPDVLNKSEKIYQQYTQKFSEKLTSDYKCSSTPLRRSVAAKETYNDSVETIGVDTGIKTESEFLRSNREKSTMETLEDVAKSRLLEKVQNKFKNGGFIKRKSPVSRAQFESSIIDDDKSQEDVESVEKYDEVFESFSNDTESGVAQLESEKHDSPEITETHPTCGENVEERIDLRNGENFDITDDESSNSVDSMVLALDESNDQTEAQPEISITKSIRKDNMYEFLNITDDESNSSVGTFTRGANIFELHRESHLDNNNASPANEAERTKREDLKLDLKSDAIESTVLTSKRSSSRMESPLVDKSFTIGTMEESYVRMTRSRRASSVAKEILSTTPLESPSKSVVIEKAKRSRRASSLIKEVLTASAVVTDENSKRTVSSGIEDPSTPSPRKARTRRASSIAKEVSPEVEEVKTPVRRSTRRAASVQKDQVPETTKTRRKRLLSSSSTVSENDDEKTQIESTAAKVTSKAPGRPAKSSKASKEDVEETENVRVRRKRTNSVPKESVADTSKTRRIKESIPENDELALETTKGRNSGAMKLAVGRPLAKTRNRSTSIQSIPEDLEEILSVPSQERISSVLEKKKTTQTPRGRRSASAELSQVEVKRRTRGLRAGSVLKETIAEEDMANQDNVGTSSYITRTTTRKRVPSESITNDSQEITSTKPRRGRRVTQESKDQFSFSQPGKAEDAPLDQRVIGEVPNFVFSPPQTRSKVVTTDQHRG